MSMFGAPEAKPYIVTVRDRGGIETKYRVLAYEYPDAMMEGSLRATATGAMEPEVVSVVPDVGRMAKINMRRSVDRVLASIGREPKKL